MAEEPGARDDASGRKLERAILLALLSADSERPARAELAATIGGDIAALDAALERLCDAGVACVADGEVWASAAARHIDGLGLIAI
jgi:hypothetical protein